MVYPNNVVRDIDGRIGYLGPMTEYPIFHSGYPAAENVTVDWRNVVIGDVRAIPGGARLASHGFAFVDHVSAVRDFANPEEVASIYPNEIGELVKALESEE